MSELPKVEITETPRGFHNYGDPLRCTYGNQVRVAESSSANGPHVWLFVKSPPDTFLTDQKGNEVSLHLNEEQARALIARLQAWVEEIPTRWRRDPEDDETTE